MTCHVEEQHRLQMTVIFLYLTVSSDPNAMGMLPRENRECYVELKHYYPVQQNIKPGPNHQI